MERADVQRAREELLREQKRVTTELQEERRNVSMERARLSSAHREIITREKHKTDTTIQVRRVKYGRVVWIGHRRGIMYIVIGCYVGLCGKN